VSVLDSGRSGGGHLLFGREAATHLYGPKHALTRMLFDGVSYVTSMVLFFACVLALGRRNNRFVVLAGFLGAAVSVHEIVMLLVDRRRTWQLDLVAASVAAVGCIAAAFAAGRTAAAPRPEG
jgi:hypothetical protein